MSRPGDAIAMQNKRPIDQIRDSALSMRVGTPDDPSAITEMLPLGDVLYVIKEKSIYACQLADTIDPERTNPHIPNIQQKVLAVGSDSPLVGKTLLTAKMLFHEHFLPDSFDRKAGLILAFGALKDLAAMQATAEQIQSAQDAAQLDDRRQQDRSVVLPATGDVSALCKSFIQKADHVLQALLGIVKLFYGPDAGKAWFESLAGLASHKYGVDDQFHQFVTAALPFLQFVRYARNCVEHPKPSQRVIITDFLLNSTMQLVPPTIEVIHPKLHQPPIAVTRFLNDMIGPTSGTFELMIAFMCAKHVQPIAGMALQVVELPEDQRRLKQGRFSYATLDGIPFITPG
jgi:hypothetical protein